jgi:hypothetical protein
MHAFPGFARRFTEKLGFSVRDSSFHRGYAVGGYE